MLCFCKQNGGKFEKKLIFFEEKGKVGSEQWGVFRLKSLALRRGKVWLRGKKTLYICNEYFCMVKCVLSFVKNVFFTIYLLSIYLYSMLIIILFAQALRGGLSRRSRIETVNPKCIRRKMTYCHFPTYQFLRCKN